MSTPPHSPVVVAAGASVDVRDSPPSDEGDPACFRNQTPTRPGPAEFHPVPYPQQQQQQQQRPQQPQPLPQPHQQPLPQQHGHLHPAMQAPAFMPMPMPFGQPMPYAAHPPFMPMPQYFLPPNYYYAPYSMQHMHMGHPMHHVPPMQSPYAPCRHSLLAKTAMFSHSALQTSTSMKSAISTANIHPSDLTRIAPNSIIILTSSANKCRAPTSNLKHNIL